MPTVRAVFHTLLAGLGSLQPPALRRTHVWPKPSPSLDEPSQRCWNRAGRVKPTLCLTEPILGLTEPKLAETSPCYVKADTTSVSPSQIVAEPIPNSVDRFITWPTAT